MVLLPIDLICGEPRATIFPMTSLKQTKNFLAKSQIIVNHAT